VGTPIRPGGRGYAPERNMADELRDFVKKTNDFFIPSVAKAELPPNLRRKVKIAPTTDFRNNGFYGPQDIRYGPPEPTSAQRTRNRTQVNNNPALPRSPGRGRNPVRPSVNETVVTNDIPVVLTPGGNEPYCPASPIPNRKPEGFPSIPPYIPPVLGGIDLGSILRDLGIESFPGVLGGLDDLFIPYFQAQRGRGNVGDTGIRQEAQQRVNDGEFSTNEEALNQMMKEAKILNNGRPDKDLVSRIKGEQKAQGDRHSRESKDKKN
jgi:Bacterial toxin 34